LDARHALSSRSGRETSSIGATRAGHSRRACKRPRPAHVARNPWNPTWWRANRGVVPFSPAESARRVQASRPDRVPRVDVVRAQPGGAVRGAHVACFALPRRTGAITRPRHVADGQIRGSTDSTAGLRRYQIGREPIVLGERLSTDKTTHNEGHDDEAEYACGVGDRRHHGGWGTAVCILFLTEPPVRNFFQTALRIFLCYVMIRKEIE